MDSIFDVLSQETEDFWADREIRVLESPTTIEFLRDAFSRYEPVIIRGCLDKWPALTSWGKDYFVSKCQNIPVNINLTFDGHGDCVKLVTEGEIDDCAIDKSKKAASCDVGEYFIYPAECDMTMSDFYTLLDRPYAHPMVPYLSQQNDNLRSSLPFLMDDIQPLLFAQEAFGVAEPEAVNLWIGDERSVSSIHKDHYENMYAVISGEKMFTLLPPTDVAFLPENEYKTLQYRLVQNTTTATSSNTTNSAHTKHNDNGVTPTRPTLSLASLNDNAHLTLTAQNCPSSSLPWIPLDPEDPEVCVKYPKFTQAHPIRCRVRPGEILYIPSMWYHRVTQSTLTVAVNYWYDQRFDFRYVFYQTIKRVKDGQKEEEQKKKAESNEVI